MYYSAGYPNRYLSFIFFLNYVLVVMFFDLLDSILEYNTCMKKLYIV